MENRGERVRGAFDNAQLEVLYGRYVKTFWDLQAGFRRDFEPVGVNYLVLGIQGLAPYWCDVGAAGFLSDKRKLGARTQAAMDLVFTQRLIVRPSVSLDWALGADERRGL
ncbi:MAG: copper resistance protein B [Gemmatimonadota bacterium]